MDNTKTGKGRGNSRRKNQEISARKTHIHTRKLNRYASRITNFFLNQKRVNVCEHVRGTSFTACSHRLHLLFVIVETYQLSFHVYKCLSSGVLFIFFGQSFFFISLFLYYCIKCFASSQENLSFLGIRTSICPHVGCSKEEYLDPANTVKLHQTAASCQNKVIYQFTKNLEFKVVQVWNGVYPAS